MHPAGFFPRENDAIAGAPEQLIIGKHGVESATRSFGSMPQLTAVSGGGIGQSNGPRIGGGADGTGRASGGRSDAYEGYLFTVGRPDGIGIAVGTGIQVAQGFCAEIIQT